MLLAPPWSLLMGNLSASCAHCNGIRVSQGPVSTRARKSRQAQTYLQSWRNINTKHKHRCTHTSQHVILVLVHTGMSDSPVKSWVLDRAHTAVFICPYCLSAHFLSRESRMGGKGKNLPGPYPGSMANLFPSITWAQLALSFGYASCLGYKC